MKQLPKIPASKLLKGKRVLLRLDLNVPLAKNAGKVVVADDTRLLDALPTLEKLLRAKARVIILAHLGEPHGKAVASLDLAPVITRLNKLLAKDLSKIGSLSTWDMKTVRGVAGEFQNGEALALQNVRFLPGEEKGSMLLARQLAKLGDMYINDAFSVDHRNHVSVALLPTLMPHYAGEQLQREVMALNRVMSRPTSPSTLVLGGAKCHDKIATMLHLVPKVDHIVLGGVLANTVLSLLGLALGKSMIDKDAPVAELKKLLRCGKLVLPIDVLVVNTSFGKVRHVDFTQEDSLKGNEMIIDIGPLTIKHYTSIIAASKTIIWNGPLGFAEKSMAARGSMAVAKAMARATNRGAFSVVGGGETIDLVDNAGLVDRMSFISSGGGAMLQYLSAQKMPGIAALLK